MSHLCKHCATPYAEGSGVGGFCCPGCQQVYRLIQTEGLEDFYRFQDRAAQPLKDRLSTGPDPTALCQAQAEVEAGAEAGQAIFEIEGMSCMGCAWLIERLAAARPGLIRAEASLTMNQIHLEWRSGDFDLSAFGEELFRFGYRVDAKPREPASGSRFSPLAVRSLLTFVFTGNALLLTAFEQFVLPVGQDGMLISLLSLICLCFVLMLGGAPFFLSAYRALRIRRWHSDCVPMLTIVACIIYTVIEVSLSRLDLSLGALLISVLVSALIGARWLVSR